MKTITSTDVIDANFVGPATLIGTEIIINTSRSDFCGKGGFMVSVTIPGKELVAYFYSKEAKICFGQI